MEGGREREGGGGGRVASCSQTKGKRTEVPATSTVYPKELLRGAAISR